MSRTKILPIKMENNMNNNLLSLLGFNAPSDFDDSNVYFQSLNNKSLGNGKQYNSFAIDNTSDINNSLLKTLNVIDSNVTNEFSPELSNETYTLDDLLDFGNENINAVSLLGESLDDELLLEPCNQILMETAMASPLSSSSEESCDLNELFMDADISKSFNNAYESKTEVSNESTESELPNATQYAAPETLTTETLQPSLEEMLTSAGTDLSAVCTLLFQNQAVASPQSEFSFDDEVSEVNSPASSESETETVRYTPYKKGKTKEQKLRKKAQNRTAATRYRIKKKDEMKIMSEEADKLEEKNKNLKGKVEGLRTEIDYLKNLMLDVIKARLVKGALPQNLLSAVTVNQEQ